MTANGTNGTITSGTNGKNANVPNIMFAETSAADADGISTNVVCTKTEHDPCVAEGTLRSKVCKWYTVYEAPAAITCKGSCSGTCSGYCLGKQSAKWYLVVIRRARYTPIMLSNFQGKIVVHHYYMCSSVCLRQCLGALLGLVWWP